MATLPGSALVNCSLVVLSFVCLPGIIHACFIFKYNVMTGKGFNIEEFVECPSVALLSGLKRNEWFGIAERYGIEVKRYWKKRGS